MEKTAIYELKAKVMVITAEAKYRLSVDYLAVCKPSDISKVKEQAKADTGSCVKTLSSFKETPGKKTIEVSLKSIKKEYLKIY